MSFWSYVHGTITVSPMGRTQAEKRYILETVLNHLPRVTGSEGDMNVYIIQKNGHDMSSSCDELGEWTNLLIDSYGDRGRHGWLGVQSKYILVVDGSLRDRMFRQTYREFMKWLCRLSKRICVEEVMVSVADYCEEKLIRSEAFDGFYNMYEWPSWCDEGTINWCEYLMWKTEEGSRWPKELLDKYYGREEEP